VPGWSRRVLEMWLWACCLLLLSVSLHAQGPGPGAPPPPDVGSISIQFVGPATVSEDLIRANIRIKPGDPFNQLAADDDVENLYGTGFFYNIRITQQRLSDGKLALTYVVQSKPILTEVRFSGNKRFSVNRLRKKISSKAGEPLDERKLFNDAQEIKKMYEKAGMQNTAVKAVPSLVEALGRGSVTFEIVEAPKIKIHRVYFEGNEAFSQRKLRKVVKTKRWNWISWLTGSGKFTEDEFADDRDRLRDFYASNGYVDFEIKNVEFDKPKTNQLDITIGVAEGTRYRVGAVTFEGNKKFTPAEILSNLRDDRGGYTRQRLTTGQIFTPENLEADIQNIQNFYGSLGHLDVRVQAQKVPNVVDGTIDLKYSIRELRGGLGEGEKSTIEKIEIKGNTKTKDKVIRRELAVSPGETFDMVRVKVSKQRLEQMNYFEKVDAKDEVTSERTERNLVVAVEEKNTGNVALGAGYSSVDKLVGYIEVSQGNFDLFNPPTFTGGGQKARVRAQIGTQRQDYIIGFTEPWFLGRRLRLDTELYYRDLQYLSQTYDTTVIGGSAGLTKQLPWNLTLNNTYTLQQVDITFDQSYLNQYPPKIQNYTYMTNNGQVSVVSTNTVDGPVPVLVGQAGETLISSLGWTLSHDTRNNLQLPTRGHVLQFEPMLAGGPLGAQANFYQLEIKASQYWSPSRLFSPASSTYDFFKEHILEVVGNIGVVEAFGSGDRGQEGLVPVNNRWYLGGLYSLRGFKFREVGPVDPLTEEPIGGGTYWFASAEYSVPVVPRVRFAFFFDSGMVYPGSYSFSPQKYADGSTTGFYNSNWGLGLRLNLPIGPLRLDYGIPIKSDRYNDSSGQFQFGVGYTRDF
jgi:outer membrane protein insertion porin family